MAKPAQNSREVAHFAVIEGLSSWRSQPIWQGLLVAVLAISGAVYGTIVSARADADRETTSGLLEGLDLLAIERDVSITAHEAIAGVTMEMYEGGHGPEVEDRLTVLHGSVELGLERLRERPPSLSWRATHEDMTLAAERLLDGSHETRSGGELLAWLDEFLFDFKRVVPTDNLGRWSALLEVATWSQEVPAVFRSHLEGAMAREWETSERAPADPSLIDEFTAVLNDLRRIRESHGPGAATYTPFEEYILTDAARAADSTSVEVISRLAAHPGVIQTEGDTPYLLSLSDQRGFESIGGLYAVHSLWRDQVVRIADELLRHAQRELGAELARANRVSALGRGLVGLSLLSALLFAAWIIRQRLRLDTRLRTALECDVLTGLANRYALFSTAPERLSDPECGSFALILLDLDDFKSINDDHGHHVGDRALVEFATALASSVRSASDIVCRVGGDEFVVFLHQLTDPVREVEVVVSRLKVKLEQPIAFDDFSIHLHFTAGVAVSDSPAPLEDLLVEADLALIEAKERDRDVTQFFRRKLGRRMTQELSTALGSGALRCAFQPQIDLQTGAIVGLEALARWQREDRRQVPTRSLIEALGWLGASKEWLHVAMRDIAAAWAVAEDHFDGRIWLNLMGSDIRDSTAAELIEILSGTGVPLDRLGVEITDPVERAQVQNAAALLRQLRDAGVGVALDDVGDDRVPLLHMTELPIDLVKLDHCLVHGIDSQAELRAVVQSLREMCERLDRQILAEGVETLKEETVLRRLGIRYVQGFLFAKPVSLSALPGFFGQWAERGVDDSVA